MAAFDFAFLMTYFFVVRASALKKLVVLLLCECHLVLKVKKK